MTFSICSLTCGSTSSESPIASFTLPAIIAFMSSGGGAGMPDILHIILNWAYMTSYLWRNRFVSRVVCCEIPNEGT